MVKKILGFMVAAIMLLGVFGLAACSMGDSLTEYKAAGKTAIQTYADDKGRDNYTEDGWTAVCSAVEDGKVAVEAATSKDGVDTAVMDAKDTIDEAEKSSAFYTLQEAFDNGWLTKKDLQSIAYYHNDDSIPVYPEVLSAEAEKAIKETRASDLRNNPSASNATEEDVSVLAYYGTYACSVAVMIADNFTGVHQANWTETVEGIDFHYNNGNRILIWENGTTPKEDAVGAFYTLQQAYDRGLLSVMDLQSIANNYNNNTSPVDVLNIEIQETIKMAIVEKLQNRNSNPISEATMNDITILKYFGTYSNVIAVILTDIYSVYGDGELAEYIVGGVIFYNYSSPEIIIWKQ